MKALRNFVDFIRNKVVKTQAQDKSRAAFLIQEAEKGYSFLQELIQKIGIRDDNANEYVKSCYDLMMELIRARMLLDGYKASGPGAHEAAVAYLRVMGFKETEVQFMNQLRFFRNGMLYYGTLLDKEYAEKVVEFTRDNFAKLKELAGGKIS